jgi:hypothetical protein
MSCHFPREGAQTHSDNDEVRQKKKGSKLPILIFIPLSQKQFYVYQLKHEFFLQIHNGWGKISPSKTITRQPSLFWMVVESCETFA